VALHPRKAPRLVAAGVVATCGARIGLPVERSGAEDGALEPVLGCRCLERGLEARRLEWSAADATLEARAAVCYECYRAGCEVERLEVRGVVIEGSETSSCGRAAAGGCQVVCRTT
jgi:hypothetical protein